MSWSRFIFSLGFVRFTCNAELVTLAQTATGNELPRDERVRPTPTTLTGVLVPVVAGVIACLSARLNYVSACPAAGGKFCPPFPSLPLPCLIPNLLHSLPFSSQHELQEDTPPIRCILYSPPSFCGVRHNIFLLATSTSTP